MKVISFLLEALSPVVTAVRQDDPKNNKPIIVGHWTQQKFDSTTESILFLHAFVNSPQKSTRSRAITTATHYKDNDNNDIKDNNDRNDDNNDNHNDNKHNGKDGGNPNDVKRRW
jgi:hypothetical protein